MASLHQQCILGRFYASAHTDVPKALKRAHTHTPMQIHAIAYASTRTRTSPPSTYQLIHTCFLATQARSPPRWRCCPSNLWQVCGDVVLVQVVPVAVSPVLLWLCLLREQSRLCGLRSRIACSASCFSIAPGTAESPVCRPCRPAPVLPAAPPVSA